MAKQRRARPRSATPVRGRKAATPFPPSSPAARSAEAARRGGPDKSGRSPGRSAPAPPRPTYVEAMALYEKGLKALQTRDYQQAGQILSGVLTGYPEEKELAERARLYLNVCRRLTTPREAAPTTPQERLYAATLAVNTGRYEQALGHLRKVTEEDPDNDYAFYLTAVAQASLGEITAAVTNLARSIELNPDNRALAKQDPDLELLRHEQDFRMALETISPLQPDRRRPARNRSPR